RDVDREGRERRRELVASTRDVRRSLLDLEACLGRDRRAGLRDEAPVDAYAPGHDERLGPATRLGKPSLAEQLIESSHAAIVGYGHPERARPAHATLIGHADASRGTYPRLWWGPHRWGLTP